MMVFELCVATQTCISGSMHVCVASWTSQTYYAPPLKYQMGNDMQIMTLHPNTTLTSNLTCSLALCEVLTGKSGQKELTRILFYIVNVHADERGWFLMLVLASDTH